MDRSAGQRLPPLAGPRRNVNGCIRPRVPSAKPRRQFKSEFPSLFGQQNAGLQHQSRQGPRHGQVTLLPSIFRSHSPPVLQNAGTLNVSLERKSGDISYGFDEIDAEMVRDRISKIKRDKIMKQVRACFLNMLTNIQSMTNGLKDQLQEVVKEHEKADKLATILQERVENLRKNCNEETAGFCGSGVVEQERQMVDHQGPNSKQALSRIDSSCTSRPSSLPEVFKNRSSPKVVEEVFSQSKTNNIRKVARKKSHVQTKSRRKSQERRQESPTLGHKPLRNDAENSALKPAAESAKGKEAEMAENIADKERLVQRFANKTGPHNSGKELKPPTANKAQDNKKIMVENAKIATGTVEEPVNYAANKKAKRSKTKRRKLQQRLGNNLLPKYSNESVEGTDMLRVNENPDNSSSANSRVLRTAERKEIQARINSLENHIIGPKK